MVNQCEPPNSGCERRYTFKESHPRPQQLPGRYSLLWLFLSSVQNSIDRVYSLAKLDYLDSLFKLKGPSFPVSIHV